MGPGARRMRIRSHAGPDPDRHASPRALTTFLFVNPGSGSGRAPDWPAALADAGVRVEATVRSLEALRAAGPNKADHVLVAGGDGTLSRVAAAAMEKGWVLGVLPSGTANDLARALGIPMEPRGACRIAASGRARRIDVASVNGEVLLNAAQIGLGPEVARAAESRYKTRWGRLGYLRGVVDRLRGRRGFRAHIEVEGDSVRKRWLNVTVANGPYFGGGHRIHLDARIDDGLLDVVALRARPWYQLAWAWLLRQLGVDYPEAVRHWRTEWVRIGTHGPMAVTLDGDPRAQTPVEVRVRRRALEVLVLPEAGEADC